jgi:hypothetical protein
MATTDRKFMRHTKYSDYVILRQALKAKNFGDFKKSGFRKAAVILNCRDTQVSGRYYDMQKDGITINDVKDWTEEDKANYYAGHEEKIERTISSGSRERNTSGKYDTTYQKEHASVEKNIPDNNTTGENDKSVIIVKNEDNTESVYLSSIKSAVLSLVKDTDQKFKLDVIKNIMKDL